MRWVPWILVACVAAVAHAQPIRVTAPPDRFVAPREYVTLVYRLESSVAVEVRLEARSASGWAILRSPGVVRLEPGRSTPIAFTLEVPPDAAAFGREAVTLEATTPTDRTERTVHLSVLERVALALEVPGVVTLGPAGLLVTVVNDGNTHERASLALERDDATLERADVELAPGTRTEVRFVPPRDGSFTLVLKSERGTEVRRRVSVLRFGAPEPHPFLLTGEVTGRAASSGRIDGALSLRGALSDFALLDARADALSWRRSYAEVVTEGGALRLGAQGRDPFRLNLPSDFGVSARLERDGSSLGATVGLLEGGAASGVLSGAVSREDYALAGAVGLRAGLPLLAVRGSYATGSVRLSAEAFYRGAALGASVGAEFDGGGGRTHVDAEARDLFTSSGRIAFGVRHRAGEQTSYALAGIPIAAPSGGDVAPWTARAGFAEVLPSSLPGDLRWAVQVGRGDSFARLTHGTEVAGWRTGNGVGVRLDASGFGVSLDSAWSRVGAEYLGADASLVYYPGSARLDGRANVRYQIVTPGASVALASGWSAGEESFGASAVIGWRDGSWSADLSGAVGYAYGGVRTPWSASVTLTSTYGFTLGVAPIVTDLAGGRRLGALEGRVGDDAEPLVGVEISIGRYRVASDEEGRYRIELPPGTYSVSVDLATVPIAYRLVDRERATVELVLHETRRLDLRAVRTTVLTGRVLEDRDRDGIPDEPAQGVPARLLLTDAEGLVRVLRTDADGSFRVRGLAPGDVEVVLVEAPSGAEVVGEARRVVRLAPGTPAEVTFAVRPSIVEARSFTARTLRIRSVRLEADRLPPGAAPVVWIEVQGESEAVELVTPDGVHALVRRDGGWTGRLLVPEGTPAGVYAFTVVARAASEEATRPAQLVVDADATVLEVTSDAPVRPGGALRVTARVYLEAHSVGFEGPFGEPVAFVEETPGSWLGVLRVPAEAVDAVHEVDVVAVAGDGRVFTQTLRFRVLAP